jgi:hypothetical protein
MTKVLIDVPDNLHRLIKTITVSKGETIKHFVLRAMNEMAKQEVKSNVSHTNDLISEDEADALLKPYLKSLVNDIDNGKEKTISSSEFFKELGKSH